MAKTNIPVTQKGDFNIEQYADLTGLSVKEINNMLVKWSISQKIQKVKNLFSKT